MGKRKMKTIGEQTGIKELDNVRQYGIDLYNLKDVIKVLGIDKCKLKSILDNFTNENEIDKINGEYYIRTSELKFILINYTENISRTYKGYVLFNDNELQEYGIVIDDRFREDNKDSELLNMIDEYRKEGVDVNGCRGNNNFGAIDLTKDDYTWDFIEDIDFDEIYKTIDEK